VFSFVIAGTHSGAGKSTLALALMAALRRRGLVVQPFKVGPDFIDPGHHTAVCGRVSRNLDTWMLTEEQVRRTFHQATADADVAIIEGVMGLFDGRSADDPRGSTAHVARLLGVPVVLVVDAEAMAASVAALVKGFAEFDPAVQLAGVICNRVAGSRHYAYLEPAIRKATEVVPLGWLPRRSDWGIPERHLGLTTAEEHRPGTSFWESIADALAQTVDLDRLLEIAQPLSGRREPPEAASTQGAHAPRSASKVRVAVARDVAFCFYYAENLELLVAAGATIIPFSPLTEAALPDDIRFLYLGGGYPELHAQALAGNRSMRDSIRNFHAQGGAIYAECGGLMYACRELVDAAGQAHPMLDLLPARTVMQSRRAALGYITLRTTAVSPLGPAGITARGHEFHYSRLEPLGPLTYAGLLERDGEAPRPDGLVSGRLWAGYAHLHFGSNPALAAVLLGASF
jgi:cobyrinic acid a,c-diamide synthase